jgi:hypothetical protein
MNAGNRVGEGKFIEEDKTLQPKVQKSHEMFLEELIGEHQGYISKTMDYVHRSF